MSEGKTVAVFFLAVLGVFSAIAAEEKNPVSGKCVATNSLEAYLERNPPKDVLALPDGTRIKTADELDRMSSRFPLLPFDQGEFLGCIAPRALVISTATGDRVSSPESNYRTYREADQVFALFGKSVGWHIKEGKHSITHDDWRWFMNYAEEVLKW